MFIALKIWKLHSTPRATLWGHEERERDRETCRERMGLSSVTQSCPTLWDPMNCSTPGFPVHHQFLELAQTRPLSQWCPPTLSSYVVPLFSRLPSFPATGSFPVSHSFTSGGQSIGVSASASCENQENGPRILFLLGSRVEFEVLTLYWWI